ncbi:MAG: aldo/keto reductase [Planctomycetes bacterium]|nr:aldo/keto reductase [Planctomycetota bacterium]
MDQKKTTRRHFLERSLTGLAGAALAPALLDQLGGEEIRQDMPYRTLGKTGEKVSILCVGGHHIGRKDEETAIRIIQEAIDNGINFMDNAWEYHDGASEERMGKALEGQRGKAFLMTKVCGRDKKWALENLEDSLRRLKTEVIDLWQFHEVVHDADPDMIFAQGGAIEAADQARKQGKVRYIGFTGHKSARHLLKMLAYEYPWDAVQMPLNVLDGSFESFEKWVLPVLLQRKIGVLAMKTRASGALIRENLCTADECWRYVIGLPVSSVVSGMETLDLLRDNLRLARTLKPMSREEMEAIRQRTRTIALEGKIERYKTTTAFDGPIGRKIHGV